MGEDITDRKQAEQQALQQVREFETLLGNIPDIIARLAPCQNSNGRYIFQYINPRIEQVTQIPVDQFIDHSSEELRLPADFITAWNAALDRVWATGQTQHLDYHFEHQGEDYYWSACLVPEFAPDGTIVTALVVARDISELKRVERSLRQSEERLHRIIQNMPVMLDALDEQGQIILWNQECERVTGYSAQEIIRNPQAFAWLYPDAAYREAMIAGWQERGNNYRGWEWELTCKDGTIKTIAWSNLSDEFPVPGCSTWGIGVDISDRKQAEQALQKQINYERLIARITQHIRQSLDLNEILNISVIEIQRVLQADRVLIYQNRASGDCTVICEAVMAGFPPMLGISFPNTVFPDHHQALYCRGWVQIFSDIHTPERELTPDAVAFLGQWAVKSQLVIPVLIPASGGLTGGPPGENPMNALWGLLMVHHCAMTHQWQTTEVELLMQLADQIAIAIKQSELYQQVQQFNSDLEAEVQERTQQLQQAFEFEATLKQITEQVRDSLDESKILQTAVEALAIALDAKGCNAALYDLEAQTSTIKYEYTTFSKPFRNYTMRMKNFEVGYQQLLAGYYFQYCSLSPYPQRGRVATLACPMRDDQGILGDLWVINAPDYGFTDQEIRLVQQVANQCAIALRQARLYQTSQAQVQELERLNQLKDDFLSTVSHELRTPLSNMNSALQMLQLFLKQPGLFGDQIDTLRIKPDRAFQYLEIMRSQYQQELNLVNDLLDLSRLEAGTEKPTVVPIDLELCLPQWVISFQDRVEKLQQTLQIQIEGTIPVVRSDPLMLERTISELLNNACKYTPPQGEIKVQLMIDAQVIQITVSNTGSEIPATELPFIFDKFYRVPSGDRWKHGGTGLGLTLVKHRVELMGGIIRVESHNMQTHFIIEIPYHPYH